MYFAAATLCAAALLPPAFASLYGESNLNHTCQLVPQYLSCSAEANHLTVDSCCVETFGGLVLATQFWDTYTGLESQGQLLPENTWGLHGLWPDFCNTSYTQYCDISRQFDPNPSPSTTTGPNGTLTPVPKYTGPGVDTFLEAFGKYDLLAWMNTYWINQGAPNVNFWAHEFSKHGTCYSTFDTPCYGPQYKEHEDVVDFFETAVEFYLGLPTWTWLEQAGITPSNTSTYTLSAVQGALEAKFGAVPYIGCTGPRYNGTTTGNATDKGYTYIDEVWYYHYVYGKPQNGKAVPVDASIGGLSTSSCATSEGALHYFERTPSSVRAL
ncbi:hypothetical protein MMC10_002103 [Thelotrema lepadinum]|nr:hypothetical protein [Thelotrema lepadinum]